MPARLAGLVLLVALVRIAVAASLPVHHDEAYYWLWARRLAWGYLDHPPLLAWLLAGATRVAGDGVLGVRATPILLGVAAAYALYVLGRGLFGEAAGGRAVLVFLAVPITAGAGLLAAPDSPLLLAWLLAAWLGWQAAEGRGGRWLGAGAAAGAALLSKVFGALVPVGLIGYVGTRRRHWIGCPEPYMAAALALGLFSPVVAWNARHDWAGLWFVLGGRTRLSGPQPGLGATVGFLTDHLALTVLTAPAFAWALWCCWRRRADPRYAFLLWMAAPLALVTVAAVPTGWAPGYWLSPAYAMMAVVLGTAWTRPIRVAVAGTAAAQLAFAALAVVPWLPPFPGAREHVGWDEVGRRVLAETREIGPGAVLVADRYETAALLGYHTRDTIP
ncbi:MAG: glycosyltransferase family 39 protein, partial [Armatimonadota bacterium]|nr:glycosyltransferase family 39 protein [Armatimonadota bacterium]